MILRDFVRSSLLFHFSGCFPSTGNQTKKGTKTNGRQGGSEIRHLQMICFILIGFLAPGGILILALKAQELMARKRRAENGAEHTEGTRLDRCIALLRQRL
jgi:hypothetical protein